MLQTNEALAGVLEDAPIDALGARTGSDPTAVEPRLGAVPRAMAGPEQEEVATLEVRLISPDECWTLVLESDDYSFVDDEGQPTHQPRLDSGNWSGGDWHGAYSKNICRDGPSNVYRLTNVRAGVPLNLRVLDGGYLPVAVRDVVTLRAGETRVVELQVLTPTRELRGRVVSPKGDPVKGAEVSICEVGTHSGINQTTRDDGLFLFSGIAVHHVLLSVKADNFAPRVEPRLAVAHGLVELELERGRTVRVEVRGPDDVGAKMASVGGSLEGVPHFAFSDRTDEAGTCTLENVPLEEVPMSVFMSGRFFSFTLDRDLDEHTVRVPQWRSVRFTVHGTRENLGRWKEGVTLTTAGPGRPTYLAKPLPADQDTVLFEQIFPGTYRAQLMRGKNKESVEAGPHVTFELTSERDVDVELWAFD